MNTQQIIGQFGALGVLIILAAVFGRWFLQRLDADSHDRKDERLTASSALALNLLEAKKERDIEREEREAMVESFTANCEAFNVTMSNHLNHQEKAFEELTKAIERLCILESTKK